MQQMQNTFNTFIAALKITESPQLYFNQLTPNFDQMSLNVVVGDGEELDLKHPKELRHAIFIAHRLSMLLVSGLKFGMFDAEPFATNSNFEKNLLQMMVQKFAVQGSGIQMIVFTTKFNNETKYNSNTNVVHVFG